MTRQDNQFNFTAEELLFVTEQKYFRIKNEVVTKVVNSFCLWLPRLESLVTQHLPSNSALISPKIFRGENYLGFPYVNLDFPRQFSANDTFALRTMFWMGNHLSLTLHLGGLTWAKLSPAVMAQLPMLALLPCYISVAEGPWEYHFEPNSYIKLSALDGIALENTLKKNFCKLSFKWPLAEIESCEASFFSYYETLLKVVKNY
ncbi:MAG: hypothetical protein RIQ89_1234 [Bacteroidota bacterium]|jgi:hypothetical protein